MKNHKAAIIIQQAWRKYVAPHCRCCLFPINLPYGPIFTYSCMCHRCPGCLKFNADSKPCSIGCSPWFPPAENLKDFYCTDEVYQRWLEGNPIYYPDVFEIKKDRRIRKHKHLRYQHSMCVIH